MTTRRAYIVELNYPERGAIEMALRIWKDYCTKDKQDRTWSKKERIQVFESCNDNLAELNGGPGMNIERLADKVSIGGSFVDLWTIQRAAEESDS